MSTDIVKKSIQEAIGAQEMVVKLIKKYRFQPFELQQCEDYVNLVSKMEKSPGQSEESLNLYKNSVITHYKILTSLARTIAPKDITFLEWQQTPVIMEILCELDKDFRAALEEFGRTIDESDDIIGIESIRVHTGFYGFTATHDFLAIPGSVSNILFQILERTNIPKKYKKAILASKTWGLNTTYSFGDRFTRILKKTRDVTKAVYIEKQYLKRIWLEPVKTQLKFMKDFGQGSYDAAEYFKLYKKEMFDTVKRAYDAGVHIANILVLPTHVGDIGHHIGPAYYNICRDEMAMVILEAITAVMKRTLLKGLGEGKIKDVFTASKVALASCDAAVYELARWDAFTLEMVTDFLMKRFRNYVCMYPYQRNMVGELHNYDFIEILARGKRALEAKKVADIDIDLYPLKSFTTLNEPQWYGYPLTSITPRFSALFRFVDIPCLLAPEPPSIIFMINIATLMPDKAIAPVAMCRKCEVAEMTPAICDYCKAMVTI
jgi:hypothetical protein